MTKCQIKNCRNESAITYYGKSICEKHWQWHCSEIKSFNIKEYFNIKDKTKEGDTNE